MFLQDPSKNSQVISSGQTGNREFLLKLLLLQTYFDGNELAKVKMGQRGQEVYSGVLN